jgi:glucose uptake protein GlcU
VFSNFVGIYLTSISVLIIYIIYKRNQPYVDHQIIGPSLLAGLMWAIAQMSWFVANDSLSQAITFPINAMVPGVIATIWSVFFFKEIKGKRNMQMLVIAIAITLMGAALVGFSK